MAAVAPGVEAPPALRLALDDLYADYADALDEGALERWPDFFLEECIYKVMPRENYERGLPVAVIFAESRNMLRDRVLALRQTIVHAPRLMRHVTGPPRIRGQDAGAWRVTASFVVFETLVDQPSQVFLVGQYHDKIVETPDGLRFAERICVYDSTIVPTSLIYPI